MFGAFSSAALTAGAQTSQDVESLKIQLDAQRAVTQQLEQKLDALSSKINAAPGATVAPVPTDPATPIVPTAPAAPQGASLTAGYNNGFFIQDPTGDYRLNVNGLFIGRFEHFDTSGTERYGTSGTQDKNHFDELLGRLYFSGNIGDPSIGFWITQQSFYDGGITLLDADVWKIFSPYLKIEAGKFWSAYAFTDTAPIGTFFTPDLTSVEWAFGLGRQIGTRASGKVGSLAYSLSVTNQTSAEYGSGQNTNITGQVATVVNLYYDILQPFGYLQTVPTTEPVTKPQLSLWVSGAYNPIQTSGAGANDLAGDRTLGANSTLNFRYGFLSASLSGYFKHTDGRGTAINPDGFNSTGWQEQAGFYVVPGVLELTQHIDGIHWGRGQVNTAQAPATGEDNWFSGPTTFSYKTLTEYEVGLNYYLHAHNLQFSLDYSYFDGSGFDHHDFSANRVLASVQASF